MAGKQQGDEISSAYFAVRQDVTRENIIAARSNYIVSLNINELRSVIFPSDVDFTALRVDGVEDEIATEVLTNMAWSNKSFLWNVAVKMWDDIITWGCAILNRYYEEVDGVMMLRLRRLPPETFSKVKDGIQIEDGVAGRLLPGIISTPKGLRLFQTTNRGKNPVTTELDPISVLVLSDPQNEGKVGGESYIKAIIPLLENLSRGFINWGRTVERGANPPYYAERDTNTGTPTPDEKQNIERALRDQGMGKSFWLPAGWKLSEMPIKPNAVAQTYTDKAILEVNNFFNPTAWLTRTGVSFTGSTRSQLDLVKMSVAGQRAMIEDHLEWILNEWLEINGWGDHVAKVNFRDAIIEEPDTINTKVSNAYNAGLITMNEAREAYGFPALSEEQMAELKAEQSEQRAGEALQSFLQFGPQKSTTAGTTSRTNEGPQPVPHDPNQGEIQLKKDLSDAYNQGRKDIIEGLKEGLHKRQVDTAISTMNQRVIVALSKDAARQYAYGSVEAYQRMRMVADATSISTRMQEFANDYTRLAITEGVTIIDGEKNNWIARKTEQERTDIYDIINKGIAEGKYPGTVEREREPGTIAADLSQYFDDRKSHAETVARTESRRIMNSASLETYAEMGVDRVEVLDGDGRNPCDICNQLNGSVWMIDFAMDHTLEHPNCVRRFVPIIPKGGYRISNNNEKLFKSRILLTGYVR